MRNHRLFGVVIAVLLSTSFLHQRPNAPHHAQHHDAVARLGGAGIQLASSDIPADLVAPDTPGPPRSNVLNPARARYMDAVWSWVTYVNAHTPPARASGRGSGAASGAGACGHQGPGHDHARGTRHGRGGGRGLVRAAALRVGRQLRRRHRERLLRRLPVQPGHLARARVQRPAVERRSRRAGPGRPGAPGPQRVGPVAGLFPRAPADLTGRG